MSVFAKEEAQMTFFLCLTFLQFQFLPSISFGLRHHCRLSTGLHCSAAKWKYRFLVKMNDLTFFFSFLWFILLKAPFLLITYMPRGKDTKSFFLILPNIVQQQWQLWSQQNLFPHCLLCYKVNILPTDRLILLTAVWKMRVWGKWRCEENGFHTAVSKISFIRG